MNIVITGFMGTGKSASGRLLAKRLGWEFFDTDEMIEKDAGLMITEIFNRKGEPYFRDVESKAVRLVSLLDNAVISCGGGVVKNPKNMDELEKNGIIINLTARPAKILEFTGRENTRPLLQVKNSLGRIKELLNEREKYYKRCAFRIDTSDLEISQVVEKILNHPEIKTKINIES
jgi:shikimate kinase